MSEVEEQVVSGVTFNGLHVSERPGFSVTAKVLRVDASSKDCPRFGCASQVG
jgi:hypothetical protein